MMRLIVCLLFIINFSFSTENDNGDSLVMKGVKAFYNYEFDNSIELLNEARRIYPNHPGVHFIWSSAKYYVSQGIDPVHATYDTLENTLDQVEPVYERFVELYPDNDQYKLYLGSTRGLRARSSLGNKDWLSVLVQAYKGFSIIEEVAKENPNLIDAQLPIGVVEYFASISNIFIRWAANLYGLEASKDLALRKISNAANDSKWAWIEASGIISFIYLWLEDKPHKAIPFTRRLSTEFPQNFYFNILQLESLIKTDRLMDAKILNHIMAERYQSLTKRQKNWYGPYFDYEKALMFFYEKNYKKATTILDRAIENYSGELDIILGNIFLLKGKVLDLQGDRNEAIVYYNKCKNLGNFSYAIQESKQYIRKPYSANGKDK